MANHVLEKHANCERLHCPICEGGLAFCTVCRGAEVELPTNCPGVCMTEEQVWAVSNGKLDYLDGKGWVKKE